MKKALSYLLGFGVLICLFILLKNMGVIGREFSAGTNTQMEFPITEIGQELEVPLNNNQRGVYRYSGNLIFGDEKHLPTYAYQKATFTFTEQLCESQKVLGKRQLVVEVKSHRTLLVGLGRYGAVIKAPIFQRQKKVCLKIKVEDLSDPIVPNLKLGIFVVNTRPCWGIECMLD